MSGYLKRLGTTGAAYAGSSVVAKFFAVALLPLYTRYLTTADYGAAEVILASVYTAGIILSLGMTEALMRFYYRFDDRADRDRAVRAAFTWIMLATTVGGIFAAVFAAPLSELLLAEADPKLVRIGVFGLWIITNYELLLALFRIDERPRAYLVTTVANVLLTVGLTVGLVVGLRAGAAGLLAGNFGATALVYVALIGVQRSRIGFELPRSMMRPMLRFGAPFMPAELSIFALGFVDRVMLVQLKGLATAGLYALAVKFSQVVVVVVRGFMLAWPPLAYSIRSDSDARGAYAYIVTYYMLVCGWLVIGLTLLARWIVRLLAAPDFFASWTAVPFLALGGLCYGLYLVLGVVIGRTGRTEFNLAVAGSAVLVNVGVNFALIPPLGIVGAGLALVATYAYMLVLLYAVSRRLFAVPFQWGRLARIVAVGGGIVAVGELAVPDSGGLGLGLRLALAAIFPAVLLLTGFFERREIVQLRAAARSLRRGSGALQGRSVDRDPLEVDREVREDLVR